MDKLDDETQAFLDEHKVDKVSKHSTKHAHSMSVRKNIANKQRKRKLKKRRK